MNIADIAIEKAVNMLKGVGAKYNILMPDGRSFQSEKPLNERKRKSTQFPYGTIKNHYMPYIENMKPGDIASIPVAQFKPEQLRSSVTAQACILWGNGNHISSVNKQSNHVEIMRTA